MKAEYFLGRIERINQQIELKTQERGYYLFLATGITGSEMGERVQTSKSGQTMSGAVAMAADILEEIRELEEERKTARKEIEDAIKTLDLKDYTVAAMLYINCMSVADVAESLKKSRSFVFKARNRIVSGVQSVLDEYEKWI